MLAHVFTNIDGKTESLRQRGSGFHGLRFRTGNDVARELQATVPGRQSCDTRCAGRVQGPGSAALDGFDQDLGVCEVADSRRHDKPLGFMRLIDCRPARPPGQER